MEADYSVRGTFRELKVRFSLADTTSLCADAIRTFDADPLAAEIFANALTTGALLAPLLEGAEKYSCQWEYPGLLGKLLVDVNARCDVRGILNAPHLISENLKAEEIFGHEDGLMKVIKFDNGSIINSGSTKAPLADITGDAGFFFSTSDQIETEFACAVRFNADPTQPVRKAAGLMLQAMPDCDLAAFDPIRERIRQNPFREILLEECPPGQKLARIAAALSQDIPEFSYGPLPGFRCSCSHGKLLGSMKLMPRADLAEIFSNRDSVAVKCEFCRREYRFNKNELIKNG
jgi:molecular chaperone Hsp33